MANFYEDQLKGLLGNPGSFQGTPGFQFARDQGLEAANRQFAARGTGASGNALAELTRLGTGYAMQDYGNQVDRLGRLTGQQQQYDLGVSGQKNQYDLGLRGIDSQNTANANNYNLGLYRASNDYTLGSERNALDAQSNWWGANNMNNNYNLGKERNQTDLWNTGINQQNADTNSLLKFKQLGY